MLVSSHPKDVFSAQCVTLRLLGKRETEKEKTRGLDDILADLRALPNVTIVTVVVKNQKIAPGRYIAGLSIKFIPSVPGQFRSPEDVKSRVLRDIRRLANVQNIFKVSAGLERLE